MASHRIVSRPKLTFVCLFVFACCTASAVCSAQHQIATYRGATMGTTYMVKAFDPPEDWGDDMHLDIDAELRRVNDQMSTYLASSEISRFNVSESTDWFAVSSETAMVVDAALEVSKQTGGAFDVTVAPLVNLWSFGPEQREQKVPTEEEVQLRLAHVGYAQLEVRQDPPALRKQIPELQVDLSAIAKGHGVDRLIDLLTIRGGQNLFVEIGGEVRVTGDKAGDPWMVGVQRPDAAGEALLTRYPIRDEAMATSGDYRNRFEVDGQFFSHTIDPRSGRPITHDLASVTVLAPDCMMADAWATAINVLGPQRGLEMAERLNLDVLLATRRDGNYELTGNGKLASLVHAQEVATNHLQAKVAKQSNTFAIIVITFVLFLIVLAAMAIGVMFGRRPISGSCGGLAGTTNDDGTTRCSICSNPVDGCKELRDRMQQKTPPPAQ